MQRIVIVIGADIKEFRQDINRYLARVDQGEDVLITQQGKPVARLVKETQAPQSVRATLADLAQKELMIPPSKSIDANGPPAVDAPGRKTSETVIENRR